MYRILLVEDVDDIRDNSAELLGLNDFEVLEAHNGNHALEILAHNKVDLIISDIIMPDMDGFRFLDNVRKDPKLRDIPFVYMSASVQEKEKKEALAKGISGFISKPFTEEELLMTIRKALGNG